MSTKELEQKVMGFMSNSEDRYAKHLIVELITALRRRDKEIEELKNASVQVVYKERERSSWEKEWEANPQDRHLFGK